MSDTPDSEGPVQAAGGERVTEARPRRVILRRDRGGSYSIFMRSRMIQGFCSEFEDITSFHIEPDTQLQVRINIQQIGALHPAVYPDEEPPQPILRARLAQEDQEEPLLDINQVEGRPLFSSAHPQGIERRSWQDEAREHIHEQMTRMRHMLNLLESM